MTLAESSAINEAIQKGVEAEHAMRKLKPFEKRAVLEELHSQMLCRKEEIIEAICVEAGKPHYLAAAEFSRALDTTLEGATAAGDSSEQGSFNSLQSRANGNGFRQMITRRFPIGLLSFVTPFNFPLNLVMHKISPAIASGCPFVLKPSDRTPITSIIIGEMLSQSTILPEGSVSVLPCTNDKAPIFSQDNRIKCISFTGSPKIGWALKQTCGQKKVALELGGNAAVVVDRDVDDLNKIADRIIFGAFAYSGQVCISVQRILIHEDIYEPLKELLISKTNDLNKLKGDPLLPSTRLGPIISSEEIDRIQKWMKDSLQSSTSSPRLLIGGQRHGNILEATLMENVSFSSPAWRKEFFGPVAVLQKFKTFKQAVQLVNDSEFGLQAGVFTKDLNKAFYAFENIEAGGVLINEVPTVRVDAQPYGGVKSSGIGREGVRYAMEEFTEIRAMIFKDIGNDVD